MELQRIIDVIEDFAPPYLAVEWDNVGWQVGARAKDVSRVLFALDVTPDVVEEARDFGAELIVTHHPLLYKPLSCVTDGSFVGRLVMKLIEHGLAHYCAHTNLDSCLGGANDALAEAVGIVEGEPLEPADACIYKLVVFVPSANLVELRSALCEAGAGVIGEYDNCSFRVSGIGSFRGSESSHPVIGQAGRLEEVEEERLEVVVPRRCVSAVMEALARTHPYEEPAYDLYPLTLARPREGLGRIGALGSETSAAAVLALLKRHLETGEPVTVVGELERNVKTCAICSGSGGSLVSEVVRRGAQLFVAGEMNYHQALEAKASGLTVILLGHSVSELPGLRRLEQVVKSSLGDLETKTSRVQLEPFRWH